MIYISGIIVFVLILFFYIHIIFYIKTNDDLDIYDIEMPTKDKLEEICDMRQPIIFSFFNDAINNSFSRKSICNLYGAYDVNLRNVKNKIEDDEELYIPISFNDSINLLDSDTDKQYLVENSDDFLEETTLKQIMRANDSYLRPYTVSSCIYDLNIATAGTQTPFRYELNYRNYFYVSEGEVKIKLAPPKSVKYLSEIRDYDNFEFISPINPWDIQDKYKTDFSKVKCLDVTIYKGQIIFIPAYWWYSFEFGENATLCVFKYKTYMNSVAILPKTMMGLLQSQNIKRISFNKIDLTSSKIE